MTEIFTGSGDPEGKDFEIRRVDPFLFSSTNGKYFSNIGPIFSIKRTIDK